MPLGKPLQDTTLLPLFKELTERRLERELTAEERREELKTLAELNSQIEEERKKRNNTLAA